jgi:methanol---5-hydroxybenzimidazolylcobamide Co-methyltransferase
MAEPMQFNKLAIQDKDELIFGHAPFPVKTRRGLVIGGGKVYPELNFTLPPMHINDDTIDSIILQYRDIVRGALQRGVDLYSNGIIFEFETLPEMTRNPDYGVEIIKVMNEVCEDFFQKYKIPSEIRLTPNDLREFERPPLQRSSHLLNPMLELFERGAMAGGDMLSIESTGGKEIFDDALMNCNIREIVFSLCVLGVRDMKMLWQKIVEIAGKQGKIAGGDTACGFANTAMVLAEKKYIPKIFAAVVRIMSVVRTIVAVEQGAKGPDKDCGYEGVFLKAITGIPVSMEGKTSACAHLSPLGNIAGACADLWSNESVQNIKLLADMAPTVYLEQLEYDTRLFNQAIKGGRTDILNLQRHLVESDMYLDPQAFILAPSNVIKIAGEMVQGKTYVESAVKGAQKGLDLIEEAVFSGQLRSSDMENVWIGMIREELDSIPSEEDMFIEEMLKVTDHNKYVKKEYGL